MTTQRKMQDLKNQAIALAKSLGLHCTQTRHLKRHVAEDLDLRRKDAWVQLIERLEGLRSSVVVLHLQQQPIAA